MLTPSKNDLCVAGNAVIDDVYEVNGWPSHGTSNLFSKHRCSVGGIGNILRALSPSSLSVVAEPLVGNDADGMIVTQSMNDMGFLTFPLKAQGPTSRAVILSDVAGGERTSFVKWGCEGRSPLLSPCSSRWVHVSYLDAYPWDMKAVRGAEVVSADLCMSNPSDEQVKNVFDNLPMIDYLFVSSSELWVQDKEDREGDRLRALKKAKTAIYHGRNGTSISHGKELLYVKNESPVIRGVDVLGAGDMYCAGFIQAMIMGRDLEGAAKEAHENVSRMLARRLELGY